MDTRGLAPASSAADFVRCQDVLAAVERSDEIFSRAKPGEDGPWMASYDHAPHHGDTGHALFDFRVSAQEVSSQREQWSSGGTL